MIEHSPQVGHGFWKKVGRKAFGKESNIAVPQGPFIRQKKCHATSFFYGKINRLSIFPEGKKQSEPRRLNGMHVLAQRQRKTQRQTNWSLFPQKEKLKNRPWQTAVSSKKNALHDALNNEWNFLRRHQKWYVRKKWKICWVASLNPTCKSPSLISAQIIQWGARLRIRFFASALKMINS